MILNEQGVYVIDRGAYERRLSALPGEESGPVRFFRVFEEALERIKGRGSERRYYTQ